MNYLLKKKKALMGVISILTRVLKSITGITSATLANVFDKKSLVLLEFQGSSAGSGDKTENLFNYSASAGFTSQYSGLTNTWDGDVLTVKCTATSRGGNIDLGKFDAGTYYISGSMYANGTTSGLNIFVNGKNFQRSTPYIITLTETSQVQLYQAFNNTIQNYTIKNIMIAKSSVATDYKPYGYQIGVLCESGNLINSYNPQVGVPSDVTVSNTTKRKWVDGQLIKGMATNNYYYPEQIISVDCTKGRLSFVTSHDSYACGITVNLKEGENYTFYAKRTTNAGSVFIMFYDEEGTFNSNWRITGINVSSTGYASKSFTVPIGAKYCVVVFSSLTANIETVFENIQIISGIDSAYKVPAYYPYSTPIAFDTYIGSQQLKSYEYVTVDFENETAKIHNPNYFDMSKITNNTKGDLVVNEDGTITSSAYPALTNQKFRDICPNLQAGDVVVAYITSTGYPSIYLKDTNTYLTSVTTLTEKMLDSQVGLYKQPAASGGGEGVISNIVIYKRSEHDEYISNVDPHIKNLKYRYQDVTDLNKHLFAMKENSFYGNTVLVDNTTNKLSEISVDYYDTKPELCVFQRDSVFQSQCWGKRFYDMSTFSKVLEPNKTYKISFDMTCEKINYDTYKGSTVGINWIGNTGKNKRANVTVYQFHKLAEGETYHFESTFSLQWVSEDDYYGMYLYANYGTLNGTAIGNDVTIRNLKICRI